MATRDFKVRNGLEVGGNITYRGGTITVFDSESVINIVKEVGNNDSDLAVVAALREDIDSDSSVIQSLQGDVDILRSDADSDSTIIQQLRTDHDTLNQTVSGHTTDIQTINNILDSDEAALESLKDRVAILETNADSDVVEIGHLRRDADSDASEIAKLRADADSDSAAIQALQESFSSDITTLQNRADSDETAIQSLSTSVGVLQARADSDDTKLQDAITRIETLEASPALADSDYSNVAKIRNDLDSDSLAIQALGTDIETIQTRLDSDETQLQTINTRIDNLGGNTSIQVSVFTFTAANNTDSDFSGADDNGQTLSYVVDKIHVYLNGILQTSGTDYTATDGSTVSFIDPPDSDDTISIVKYLGTVQAGFDSDQVVAIIGENTSADVESRLDSDETKLQDHSIRIETLESRADSDETAIQTINTAVGVLQARADSDETQLQVLNTSINDLTTRLDSDSTVIQQNTTDIAALRADVDSDTAVIQSNTGRIDTLESRADSDEGILQSLTGRVDILETNADSDVIEIGHLRRDADSDASEIARLRAEADSDSAAIQALQTTFSSDISTLQARADSDETAIQALGTSIAALQAGALTDSDLSVVADLRNDVDSDSTKLQALETTVAGISSTSLADSDVTVITGAKSLTTNQIIGGGVTDVDTFATSLFRSVKYVVVASSDSDASYQADEILVVHDGSYAYLTQYAQVSTSDSELVTYDVTISSDNVLLQATPTRNNIRFDAQRLHVSVANNSILDLTIVPNWDSPVESSFRDSDLPGASFFARATAISNDGNYAAFGNDARDDSDGAGNNVSNVGGVYIYKRDGSTWTREALLKADSENTNDYLGYDVSLNEDGTYCVAGCQTSGQPNKVRVFTRSGTTWTQQTELMASNAETYDLFGERVDISADGNYIVVAARQEDDSDGSTANCGALYIFKRDGVTWSEEAILRADDRTSNDYLGSDDVSINSDGSTVVGGATGAEAAYVFTRTGTTWTQQAKLTASNSASGDNFGESANISKDGNYIIVGAIFEDDSDDSVSNRGAAYIYKKDGVTWSEEAILYSSDGAANDRFGASVTINSNGKYVAVGATLHDVTGTNNEGAVYIYERDGTTWTQIKKLVASDRQQNDQFGGGINFSDNAVYLSVGVPFEDGGEDSATNQGQAYIFDATP